MITPETDNESNLTPASDRGGEVVDFDDIYESPAISRSLMSQRSKLPTACERYLVVTWFALPREVRCYCRIMHAVVYSNEEKSALIACDGRDMTIEQLLTKQVEADAQGQAVRPLISKRKTASRR